MKREKISLFILVVEIAVIALLHSAKSNQPNTNKPVVKGNAATISYQLTPGFSISSLK